MTSVDHRTRARPVSPHGDLLRRAGIPGALAVALLLFGTRWASYLGLGGSVFLTDLLMTGAVVLTVLRSLRGDAALVEGAAPRAAPWPVLVAGGWVVLRLLIGGDFSLIAVRDAAPYIYILLGLLGFYAVRRASAAQRAATARLFVVALVLHAIWYAAQVAWPPLPDLLPTVSTTQGLHVFSERPDVDCTFIGLLGAIILWRVFSSRRRAGLLLVAYAACWIPIALSSTRAGVLAAAAESGLVLLLVLTDRSRDSLDRARIAVVVLVALVVGIGLLLTSSVGEKFVATVAPSAAGTSVVSEGAEGTARARSMAWSRLVEWSFEDPERAAVGVGFGPNFLVDSGASKLLVNNEVGGDTVPRSPHNYWLGSLARLGTIGDALVILAVLITLRSVWRVRRRARREPFVLLVSTMVVGLLIPASLGVVLESPFAAVPFWWSAGCVLGLVTIRATSGADASPRARSAADAMSRAL